MVKGASSTKMEHVVKMMQNSSRANYKEINTIAKVMKTPRPGLGSHGQDVSYLSDYFEGADAGINRINGDTAFYSVTNPNGGKIYVSTNTVTSKNFANIVDTAKGNINVLTGTHGTVDGAFIAEKQFFTADLARWGNMPNVNVIEVTKLPAEELAKIMNSSNTNLCAWCFSERSKDVLDALNLLK